LVQQVDVCLLSDLITEGPFASIFTTPTDPRRGVDWLGRPPQGREERR
jgi:hypothetical protein